MGEQISGQLNAKGMKFAIVVSRFNEFLTGRLLEGAKDALLRHGADEKAISVVHVPGSFEIPYAARAAASTGRWDAVICLGAVIRGDTPHFDFVAAESAKGIAQAGLDTGVPTIFGVLTTDTLEQAIERSGSKSGNKGWDAALSAIEMVDLERNLKG